VLALHAGLPLQEEAGAVLGNSHGLHRQGGANIYQLFWQHAHTQFRQVAFESYEPEFDDLKCVGAFGIFVYAMDQMFRSTVNFPFDLKISLFNKYKI
jgi:hypothetical protein